MAGAIGLSALAWPEVAEGARSYAWPTTGADLLTAGRWWQYQPGNGVDEGTSESWLYLRYAYSVGDRDLEGGRYDVSTPTSTSRKHRYSVAQFGMARHAIREAPRVTIHYDPEAPERSVLRPGVAFGTTWLLMVIVTLLGAAALFWRLVGKPRGELWEGYTAGVDPADFDAETGKRKRKSPAGSLLLWCLLFPLGWTALAVGMAGLWEGLLDGTPPVWPLLAYGAYMIAAVFTRLEGRLAEWIAGVFLLGIPAVGIAGFVFVAVHAEDRLAFEAPDALLVERLESPHPAVRASTAWEIRDRGAPQEAASLLAALRDDPDEHVRKAAASAARRLDAVRRHLERHHGRRRAE
jgi:hypothetical protein